MHSVLDSIKLKAKCEDNMPFYFISREKLDRITRYFSDISFPPLVNEKDIIRQILLHLPRFSEDEQKDFSLIADEIQRITNRLLSLREQYKEFCHHYRVDSLNPDKIYFDKVQPETAKIIHERFHYLESFREEAIHFGLYYVPARSSDTKLMGLVTISPFDLINIENKLPFDICAKEIMVLSRIFVFNWAPKNTVSYLLGRIFSWLRMNMPTIKILLTYLNPNLGFTGAVYKATNWLFFGREKNTRYFYIDSNYVTERFVRKLYGTSNILKLRKHLGNRISSSIWPLLPLELYIYFVDPGLRRIYKNSFSYEFERS